MAGLELVAATATATNQRHCNEYIDQRQFLVFVCCMIYFAALVRNNK